MKKNGMIAIPACNEGASLVYFLPSLKAATDQIADVDFKVVVIDDGSNDDTADVVRARTDILLLQNGENRGLGFSLRRACKLAADQGCDFLITMDCDGQHDVGLIQKMLDALPARGHDCLVVGSRFHPESEQFGTPLDRDLLNVAYTAVIHSVTGWANVTDPLSGFWVMTQPIARFFSEQLKQDRYGMRLEGLIKLWYLFQPTPKVIEVPHPAIYRNHGTSFLNREYSPANQEDRIERFGTHASNVLSALEDVREAGFGERVEAAIKAWRANC